MRLTEVAVSAIDELSKLTRLKPSGVVGINKEEDGWRATIEMIEKNSIPDSMDILGTYDVKLDSDGNIIDFSRTKLRKRSDTSNEEY